MTLKLKLVSLLVASLFLTVTASASSDSKTKQTALTHWYDADAIKLSIQDDQNDWTANWQISVDHKSNSLKIVKNDHFLDQNYKGTLIVLLGKVMLSKDIVLKPGYEIDALDTPVIMLQLLLTLLNNTVPDGPQNIGQKLSINHTESTQPIRVSTNSASAFFKAPWTVTGTLAKKPHNTIVYDVVFSTTLEGDVSYILNMTGELAKTNLLTINDEMRIEDWQVFDIGPNTKRSGSNTILNYGAQRSHTKAKTIGELRQELEFSKQSESNSNLPAK